MRMSRTLVGRLRAPALPALADTGISSVRPARPRCVAPGVPELALRPGPLPGRDLGLSFWRPGPSESSSVTPRVRGSIFVVIVGSRMSGAGPPLLLRASRGPHPSRSSL